jgi:hypothetical protein
VGLGGENDRGVSFDGSSYAANSRSMYKLSIEGDSDVPTLSDSGSNIDVITVDTARALEDQGFEYHAVKPGGRQHTVQFGKEGAMEPVIGYILARGLVQKLAVVANMGANLISVYNLTKRGVVVKYDVNGVELLYNNKVIMRGDVGEEGLYHLNLLQLLLTHVHLPDTELTTPIHADVYVAYSARMNTRHTAKAVAMAMELHKNLKHLPYSTMADNVECGAWGGLHKCITPSLLRMLAHKRNCITCAVSRWNQLPMGDIDHAVYAVGEAFSIDYLGKFAVKSMGFDGMFGVCDMASDRAKCYGTRSKGNEIDAVRQWVLYMLSHGHRPRWCYTDAGSVEGGQEFVSALNEMGITVISQPDHISQYHIERVVQMIENDMSAIIECTPSFGAKEWLPAATFSCELRATCANTKTRARFGGKSPIEVVEGRRPSLGRFLSMGMGDLAVAKTPKRKRGVTVGRNEVGRIVGVSTDGTPGADFELLDSTDAPRRRGHLQRVDAITPSTSRKVEWEKRVDDEGTSWIDMKTNEGALDTRAAIDAAQEGAIRLDATQEGGIMENVFVNEGGDECENVAVIEGAKSDRVEQEMAEYWREKVLEHGKLNERVIAEWREKNGDNVFVDKQGKVVRSPMTRKMKEKGESPSYWVDGEAFAAFWRTIEPSDDALNDEFDVFELLRHDYTPNDNADPMLSEYWRERLNKLAGFDAEDVHDIHYLSEKTGLILSDEDDNESGYESDAGDLSPELCEEAKVAAVLGDWQKVCHVYKVRVKHDHSNPTNGMLRKDRVLREQWKASDVKEFGGMLGKGTIVPVSKEVAISVGVTPHVTTRTTKRDGGYKTRISNDGRYELRGGMFATRAELHSPAMDDELMKLLLVIAAYHNYRLGGADVSQAFTHNHMHDARIQRRIIWWLDEIECGVPGGRYYELMAVSYGCADAGSEWYGRICGFMVKDLGFTVSVFHPCLFIKYLSDGSVLLIGLATDNCLIVSPPNAVGDEAVAWFRKSMDSKWPMTHEQSVSDILGNTITRGDDGSITITQPAMLEAIRSEFFPDRAVRTAREKLDMGMTLDTKYVPLILTPLAPNLMKEWIADEEETETSKEAYQHKLGVLSYMRWSRYDAVPALSRLAKFTARPTIRHERGLYWLAAFLLSSEEVGITYHRGPPGADIGDVMEWVGYGDASWASSENGFSRFGAAVFNKMDHLAEGVYQGAMIGKSTEEKGVPSMNASIAELHGSVLATDLVLPLRGMSEEIAGIVSPTTLTDVPEGTAPPSTIHLDNASLGIVIKWSTSHKGRGMRKVARLIQYIKGLEEVGLINVNVIPGSKQLANPMTKFFASPTDQWREAEYLQGSHPAMTAMQEVAKAMGDVRRRQQMTYKGMNNEVDDGNLVYGGDEEAMTNTVSNMTIGEVWAEATQHGIPMEVEGRYKEEHMEVESVSVASEEKQKKKKHKQGKKSYKGRHC